MVMNTPAFGELVRGARGNNSQDEIDGRGGPPRQRQAPIERGDSVDLTLAVLDQIDTAFAWPPSTSAAVLSDPRRPTAVDVGRICADSLGVDAAGTPVSLPRTVAAATLTTVIPIIKRWVGPVVIDASVPGAEEFLNESLLSGTKVVRRVGVTEPAGAQSIAIDPIGILRRFQRALDLVSTVSPPIDLKDLSRSSLNHLALTILYVASQAMSTGSSGLAALQDFCLTTALDPAPSNWLAFLKSSGLNGRHLHPARDVGRLFDGLLQLADSHVDAELRDAGDGLAKLEPISQPGVVGANALGDDSIIAYDGREVLDLVALIDWAYADQRSTPLLVVNKLAVVRAPRSSRLIMIDPGAPLTRNVADVSTVRVHKVHYVAELIQLAGWPPDAAVLLPATELDGSAAHATRVWLGPPRIVSNRGGKTSTSAALQFFRQHRDEFGEFVAARLHPINDQREPAPLALVDDKGDELQMWGLACGYDGNGPETMADILSEAGFGSTSEMQRVTSHERADWPYVLTRDHGDAA